MDGEAYPTGLQRWTRAFVERRPPIIHERLRARFKQGSLVLRMGYIRVLVTRYRIRGWAVLRVRDKGKCLRMGNEGDPLRLWDEGQGVLRVRNKCGGSRPLIRCWQRR